MRFDSKWFENKLINLAPQANRFFDWLEKFISWQDRLFFKFLLFFAAGFVALFICYVLFGKF